MRNLSDIVFNQKPLTMRPTKALRLMWDGGFGHIPIVDRGKVRGVVSCGDVKGAERGRLEDEREIWGALALGVYPLTAQPRH